MTGQRFSPRALGAPGKADGTYGLAVSDELVDDLTPVITGLTSDDASVVINDNGDGTLDLAATGGGAGGGTGKDRRWNVGAAETTIDEFNDDSLAAAWTRVDGTGAAVGNASWTEGADVLSLKRNAANTANAINGFVRPIGAAPATGDAWVTCMTLFGRMSTNYILSGIIISDGTTHGAGKQISAELASASASSTNLLSSALSWSNWSTAVTVGTTTNNPPMGTPTYLRLVYKGSSQWRADTSPDAISWMPGASLVTLASFTPSHVGFYSRDGGSGTLSITSYEFLRRVSGVS